VTARRVPVRRRHLGLYAYRVAALLRLAALPPSPLEQLEKLEQLRALEHGMDIRVADAVVAPGPDVNTEQDLAAVAALLEAGATDARCGRQCRLILAYSSGCGVLGA